MTESPSYQPRNLAVLSYAIGFTLWHYKAAPASLATVMAPRFFEEAKDMLAEGDAILVSASDSGALLFVGKDYCVGRVNL